MTNGEKLRQLSDEDMLKFFFGQEAYTISMAIPVVTRHGNMQVENYVTKRFLDWMKEEVNDE